MIDMEMGADDGIDRLASIAGRREIRQKARLKIVPGRNAPIFFVVTETGVDDDPATRRFDDERVDAHFETPVLVGEIRLKPTDRQDRLRGRLRQDETASA